MKTYQVPVSIILAGIIIAGAIITTGGGSQNAVAAPQAAEQGFGNQNSRQAANVRPVDESDHVLGSRDAKVFIVEYSDFECPFCSRIHPTLETIVEEFDGEVAWAYRHLPLSFHPNARS